MFNAENEKLGKPIEDIKEIRIIIRNGRGLGNQKAGITLMQRLRELGFKGTFDIRYLSGCADRLQKLIPEFKPLHKGTISIQDKNLGELTLTPLSEKQDFPSTLITMVGADDFGNLFLEKKCQEYNTDYYVTAKATDFHLGSYQVISRDEKIKRNLNKL